MLNGQLQLHLRSVLLPNKVKMNTFTNNLPFVEDEQTRFLELADFFTCFHPEKPRDIQLLSHQSLSACKDGGYREKGLLKKLSSTLTPCV